MEDPSTEPLWGMGGHGAGESEPGGQKWSTGHGKHEGWSVRFWYVPGSQAEQVSVPANPMSHTQSDRSKELASEVSFSGHGVGTAEA
jgi:hypothetical protein